MDLRAEAQFGGDDGHDQGADSGGHGAGARGAEADDGCRRS
jgi:hypothetical protein